MFYTSLSLCFVFFRLTNRCLEWTWMVPVLQWHLGHLVPPWAAGWHPHLVRPSAPSSGSKWMRDDGGQGAPHPSIPPVLLLHHSHPEFYSCTVIFFPSFLFPTITTLESIDSTCPLCIDQVSESMACKRLAALTVLFAIIFSSIYIYIYFWGVQSHISYKKAAGPIIQASNISLPNSES